MIDERELNDSIKTDFFFGVIKHSRMHTTRSPARPRIMETLYLKEFYVPLTIRSDPFIEHLW